MNLISFSMKEQDLKRLVEKYYNGESTEAEEEMLRNFFRYGDVPRGYEAEKTIFGFFDDSRDIPEPSVGFEDRILAGINESDHLSGRLSVKRYLLPSLSAAAGILLLAGTYFVLTRRTAETDTFKDPAIAYAETVKILREVSLKMNKGAQALEPVGRLNEVTRTSLGIINKSKVMVGRNLKSLQYLKNSSDVSGVPDENDKNRK